jgi:hypothetical protein
MQELIQYLSETCYKGENSIPLEEITARCEAVERADIERGEIIKRMVSNFGKLKREKK